MTARHSARTFIALALVLAWAGMASMLIAAAPEARRSSATRSDREALTVLKAECFSCHNQEKKKGGLVLTTRDRLLEGADSGPVVVPGKPDASRLTRVLQPDSDPHMPPRKQLTDDQIRAL